MDRRRILCNQKLTESITINQNRYSLEEAFDELNKLYEADEPNKPDTNKEAKNIEDSQEPEATAEEPAEVAKKLQNSNYEQFVKILDGDGKSKAFLDYLKKHYKLGDDAIGTVKAANPQEGTIACSKLVPTQENISLSKSLGMIDKPGWSIQIINTPTEAFNTPTVTYAGKYIIDGHHRWSKAYALNGGDCKIKVLNFPAIEGVSWEDMLKAVQLAIVATNPDAQLINGVGNDNMLALGKDSIKKFVIEKACDEVIQALIKKDKGDNKETVADKIGDNVVEMQATSQPVKGAKPRAFMPQMDDAGQAKNQIEVNGVVDMTA
jgi:hypothetical protein